MKINLGSFRQWTIGMCVLMPWMLLAHTSRQPALGLFRVVACHGGAVEARVPDNSMASLQNAIKWLCYATTCDICLTADGHVLVAAMDEEGCVNGLRPWEHPRQEILDAGKLDNGEQIPLLETYLDSVMVPYSATRLWLVLTSPPGQPEKALATCRRALEIVQEKGAERYVELIAQVPLSVLRSCKELADKVGVAVAWTACEKPETYRSLQLPWACLPASEGQKYPSGIVEAFQEKGIQLSIGIIDRKTLGGESTSDFDTMLYYVNAYPGLKTLTTHYPSWLTLVLQKAGVDTEIPLKKPEISASTTP